MHRSKYVGAAVFCRDPIVDIYDSYDDRYVSMCAQRGGLHGLYQLPSTKTKAPEYNNPMPLARTSTWSTYAGFWFYLEEV